MYIRATVPPSLAGTLTALVAGTLKKIPDGNHFKKPDYEFGILLPESTAFTIEVNCTMPPETENELEGVRLERQNTFLRLFGIGLGQAIAGLSIPYRVDIHGNDRLIGQVFPLNRFTKAA